MQTNPPDRLVERLRGRTVPVMASAGVYEYEVNRRPDILCVEAADTLSTLQERCERLEQAARAALPWVTGEAEATALEEALTAPADVGS